MPEPTLSEDDYALIVGRVYIDAFTRIRSLERQLSPLRDSFQSQLDVLRTQVREREQDIHELEQELREARDGKKHGSLGT